MRAFPKSILNRLLVHSHYVAVAAAVLLVFAVLRLSVVADDFLSHNYLHHQKTRAIIKTNLLFQRGYSQALLALEMKDRPGFEEALEGFDATIGYLQTSEYLPAEKKEELIAGIDETGGILEKAFEEHLEKGQLRPARQLSASAVNADTIFATLSGVDVANWQDTINDASGQDLRFTNAQAYTLLLCATLALIITLLLWSFSRRHKVEQALVRANAELETRVRKRTAELEAANRTLQQGAQRLKVLFDNASDPIFLHDLQGRILDVNRQASLSLGYPPEDLLRMSVGDVEVGVAAEDMYGYWKGLPKAEPVTLQGSHRRKDGSTLPVEVRINKIDLGEEEVILAAARDITEHRQAEERFRRARDEAEAANRAKSEFLANMSHEIRTPMNGVLGMTELVLESELSAEQHECLSLARESAQSLLALLNSILDFSKIEAGKFSLDEVDFNLEHTLLPPLEALQVQAQKKGLELSWQYDPQTPLELRGDPLRLRQVLGNLAGNAIKFTENGSIDIYIGPEAPSSAAGDFNLHIAVSDTGIGIFPEKLPHIFESFAQVDGSITRQYGGTGLGLTISRELVAMMGGEIWAESMPGEGSVFHFTARLAPGQQFSAAEETVAADVPAHAPPALSILLAEDNFVNQRLAVKILEKRGHQLTVASTGAEALLVLEAGNFDLVLMDIQMPDLDGLDATRVIRSGALQDIARDIPIIAITAHALKGDEEWILAGGFDGYLAKPLRAGNLVAAVERYAAQGSPPP